MARVNLPLAVFCAGAAIFCAAGWTSQSLAAFVSHGADAPSDFGANGTAVGALPGSTPSSAGTTGSFTITGNGMPSTAPALAAPTGFERSSRRVRELDFVDPWNADRQLRAVAHKKMDLEAGDPWNPALASARHVTYAHTQLMLDESDPWSIVSKPSTL